MLSDHSDNINKTINDTHDVVGKNQINKEVVTCLERDANRISHTDLKTEKHKYENEINKL